jgi:hypothetical protein
MYLAMLVCLMSSISVYTHVYDRLYVRISVCRTHACGINTHTLLLTHASSCMKYEHFHDRRLVGRRLPLTILYQRVELLRHLHPEVALVRVDEAQAKGVVGVAHDLHLGVDPPASVTGVQECKHHGTGEYENTAPTRHTSHILHHTWHEILIATRLRSPAPAD